MFSIPTGHLVKPASDGIMISRLIQQLAYEQTVSKKTRKNRKKSLKRRRRIAAKTRLADQGQQGDAEEEEEDGGSDGSEIDEEIRKDVEDAYAEFIGSGGHSSHQQNDPNLRPDGLLESLNQTWDQLEKVDRKSAVLGSKVAIRTIELSVESFTPETMTYYGTLVGTNESTLALKLDRGCIPTGQGMMETSGYDQPMRLRWMMIKEKGKSLTRRSGWWT
ncbi:hypothetical protein PGTUg99_007870 [Puccinia graminis f. sp. tritici]|uniref:Uncharacterized protein n=1 Tax=Puccinia graminis f. sp. tritici TaxID=56615 RepID=A0A5B0QDS4_PUCGR|nr:hypothetical protein PGTUg99_007870 [Puccinia graminis f. sp. tritici]